MEATASWSLGASCRPGAAGTGRSTPRRSRHRVPGAHPCPSVLTCHALLALGTTQLSILPSLEDNGLSEKGSPQRGLSQDSENTQQRLKFTFDIEVSRHLQKHVFTSTSKSHERPVATYTGTKRLGGGDRSKRARGGPGELGSGLSLHGLRGSPAPREGEAGRADSFPGGTSALCPKRAPGRLRPSTCTEEALSLRVLRSEGCRPREQDQRQGRCLPGSGERSRC